MLLEVIAFLPRFTAQHLKRLLPAEGMRGDSLKPSSGALELVRLTPVMERTQGSPELVIGLIDEPIAGGIPTLPAERIRVTPGAPGATCVEANSVACQHGTSIASILVADRGSPAPAICPACTLLIRPIFPERTAGSDAAPSASPEELADALIACMDAGARVVNLSLGLLQTSARGERDLGLALDAAARRDVIIVAAAGNQGIVGGSCLVRHAWVIPVAACDLAGAPLGQSNLGASIGRRGIPSRLGGVRKVVDVIFSFVNRTSDVVDKSFVRVDVTEEFPFLVTKMSPYFDR